MKTNETPGESPRCASEEARREFVGHLEETVRKLKNSPVRARGYYSITASFGGEQEETPITAIGEMTEDEIAAALDSLVAALEKEIE